MPALASPQMYALQMAAEKTFGHSQYDRLRPLVVTMSHPEALKAVTSSSPDVAGYFSAPPFTQMALRDPNISTVLTSTDAFGGKTSFLVAASTRRYLDKNPKMAEVITQALDEATTLIRTDTKKAAQLYLMVEPSKMLDAAAVEGLVTELRYDFGIDVHGVKANAEFMARIGQLKHPPASWSDVFVSSIRTTQSD
jgi:NitT/TauT family transport system substrate-binding protein